MAILVYKLTCGVSGKSYVGITSRSLDRRWMEHCGKGGPVAPEGLATAIRNHGAESFAREIIATTDTVDEALSLERHFIRELDTFNNGYNLNEGGFGWSAEKQRDKVTSQETRDRMSAAKLGDKSMANRLGAHTKRGADNPRSGWFVMSCPDGILRIGRGLREFVQKHKLHRRHLVMRGHSKGFYLLDRFTPPAAGSTALT